MIPIRHIWRCILPLISYSICSKELQEIINQDVDRNLKWDKSVVGKSPKYRFAHLMLVHKQFRNIFYMRIRNHTWLVFWCKLFLKDIQSVEILSTNIGGGFMISHYHSVIQPQKAGKNLRIGPGVVIGKNNHKFPIIGDNVYIAANSTVIGGITIGDNVIIGAGTGVTKDIPGNSVYVGNPPRLIKRIDNDPALLNEIC